MDLSERKEDVGHLCLFPLLLASFSFSLGQCNAKTLACYPKERYILIYVLKDICHSFIYKSKKVEIVEVPTRVN